jgi:hypothetical protein
MMEAPNNKRPVSVMHIQGTVDEYAPFKGGFGKGFGCNKGVTDFRSVEHIILSWIKNNGCKPEPEVIALPDKTADEMKCTRKTWHGGKDGSEAVLIDFEGSGHTCGQCSLQSLCGAGQTLLNRSYATLSTWHRRRGHTECHRSKMGPCSSRESVAASPAGRMGRSRPRPPASQRSTFNLSAVCGKYFTLDSNHVGLSIMLL